MGRNAAYWTSTEGPPDDVSATSLAGEEITGKLTEAPGNGARIGGLKVTTEHGWFAARPSGTEDIYKIYAESFRSDAHLAQIVAEAQDGMLSSLGMKVDAKRRLLWVISTGTPEMRGSTPEDVKRSMLAAIEQLMLRWLNASLAAPNTTTSSGRDASAASKPFMLGVSTE